MNIKLATLAATSLLALAACKKEAAPGTDTAGSSPGTGTRMIGGGNTLAAFDQRPYFLTAIDNGFQTLEHQLDPLKNSGAAMAALPNCAPSLSDYACRAKSARWMAPP